MSRVEKWIKYQKAKIELVCIPDKILLPSFLVGFSPMHPFIGFAEWADILLNVLYKIKDHSLLVMPGVEARNAPRMSGWSGFI